MKTIAMPPGSPVVKVKDIVPAIADMDKRIFCLHMNKRHSHSMAGHLLDPTHLDDYVEGLFRTFHEWLHNPAFPVRPRTDLDHEHATREG